MTKQHNHAVPPKPLSDEQIARLREGLTRRAWSQADLANAADVRDSTISAMLRGDSGPRSGTLTDVCKALGISKAYVMLGIEPKFVDDSSQSATELKPVNGGSTPGLDRWLVETIEGRSTSPEERARLRLVPWLMTEDRYEDETYSLVLYGLRQAMNKLRQNTPSR